jgi:hypothetical protein
MIEHGKTCVNTAVYLSDGQSTGQYHDDEPWATAQSSG